MVIIKDTEKRPGELVPFSLKRSLLGSPKKHLEIGQKKSNGAMEIHTGYLNFYFTNGHGKFLLTMVKRVVHRGFGISIHRDNKTWTTQKLQKPNLTFEDQVFALGNG